MELLAAFLFALAVSSDGFAVGVAYGIKKIKIPTLSLAIIALASASAVTISMSCGLGLTFLLSAETSQLLGAIILAVIGLGFLLQAWRDRINDLFSSNGDLLLTFQVKPLGIIVQIIKEPSTADLDRSGEISLREAFFLGLALAMDAFGAGLGLAMAGCNILFTAFCVGMLKFILVGSGLRLGRIIRGERLKSAASLLTGLLLVCIAVIELIS